MKSPVVMFVIACLMAAVACDEPTRVVVPGDDPITVDATPIEIHTDCSTVALFGLELDPVVIQNIQITGDLLTITAEYAGGCADHAITLHACDGFLESWPPQSPIILVHDDPDDPCDAVVTEDLVFDLVPLKDTYRAGQGRSRTLVLNVYESGNPPHYRPEPRYDMGTD